MGEAGRRRRRKETFLSAHPTCCYCGARADTVDHCPPRGVFPGRHWPETFEFPCCDKCNNASRADEQVAALMFRVRMVEESDPEERAKFTRLVQEIRNNQPEIAAEWETLGAVATKNYYREAFADEGQQLRHRGYGAIAFGPLAIGALQRVAIKLAQALYYKHCNDNLRGAISVYLAKPLHLFNGSGLLQKMLEGAPLYQCGIRNGQSLEDSFSYRFNFNVEIGALYAVVRFNEQMIFYLIAMRKDMANTLIAADQEGHMSGDLIWVPREGSITIDQ